MGLGSDDLSPFSATELRRFERVFHGSLIWPSDGRYADARQVFNALIDRRPALIATCSCRADVENVIRFSRSAGLAVAVRGGGHSLSGLSVCDDGVVIDLGAMRGIEVDKQASTVWAGPGLRWADLDRATYAVGAAVTGGRVSTTGIAGLTLGSGSGWLERKYGLTCESLIGAELISANGDCLLVDEQTEPEVLWGLRGGGGNLGVVTAFRYRLHPISHRMYGGTVLHRGAHANSLLRFYRDFMEQAPDEICGGAILFRASSSRRNPPELRGQPAVMLLLLYVGDPTTGREAMKPLVTWGKPVATRLGLAPYPKIQRLVDERSPWGVRNLFRVRFLRHLSDQVIDSIVSHAARIKSSLTQILLEPMGGALIRTDEASMAMELPDATWGCHCLAAWQNPRDDPDHVAWIRSLLENLEVASTKSTYPNFAEIGSEQPVPVGAYIEPDRMRLRQLKERFDPENLFALNPSLDIESGEEDAVG